MTLGDGSTGPCSPPFFHLDGNLYLLNGHLLEKITTRFFALQHIVSFRDDFHASVSAMCLITSVVFRNYLMQRKLRVRDRLLLPHPQKNKPERITASPPLPLLHARAPSSPQPLIDCLLAFPGLFLPPPPAPPLNDALFFLTLNPLRSPELAASPDLTCFFLPPKPYFSFFFWRLWFVGPEESPGRPLPADLGPERSSLSIATSKRSEVSWVSWVPVSWRSVTLSTIRSLLFNSRRPRGEGRAGG